MKDTSNGTATDDGMHDDPDVSVVVPLYNEQHTLEALLEQVVHAVEGVGLTVEVVFVDDGSTDGSADELRRLAATDRRARPVSLRRNFGKATALATGIRASRGRYVVTLDADLQDDPQEIPMLLAKLQDGYDVVSGWKKVRRDPVSRRIASKTFNYVTRRLSRVDLHDFNCGLKAYSRPCADEIVHYCYGELHRYLPVLAHWRGHRVTEVVVNHRPRAFGRSRYGLERYARGLLDLVTALSLARYPQRTMHVLGGLGLALLFAGTTALAAVAVDRAALHRAIGQAVDVPGLEIGLLLCLAGIHLLVLGVVAELLTGPRMTVPSTVAYAARPIGADAPATRWDEGYRRFATGQATVVEQRVSPDSTVGHDRVPPR